MGPDGRLRQARQGLLRSTRSVAIQSETLPAPLLCNLRRAGQRSGFQEIADALDLINRVKLRSDQDFLKAHLLHPFDALARLIRWADEIDAGQLRQLRRFRAFLEVDRAVGEDGIGAARLAVDLHAVSKILQAAVPARWRPALRFLRRVGDPARAAPSPDQDRRPAFAAGPGR